MIEPLTREEFSNVWTYGAEAAWRYLENAYQETRALRELVKHMYSCAMVGILPDDPLAVDQESIDLLNKTIMGEQ